jgi:hypothetical protein
MLTPKLFEQLAADLAALNHLAPDLAGMYAALIGDRPEFDDDRNAVVRDQHGAELARLKMPADWFDPRRVRLGRGDSNEIGPCIMTS